VAAYPNTWGALGLAILLVSCGDDPAASSALPPGADIADPSYERALQLTMYLYANEPDVEDSQIVLESDVGDRVECVGQLPGLEVPEVSLPASCTHVAGDLGMTTMSYQLGKEDRDPSVSLPEVLPRPPRMTCSVDGPSSACTVMPTMSITYPHLRIEVSTLEAFPWSELTLTVTGNGRDYENVIQTDFESGTVERRQLLVE